MPASSSACYSTYSTFRATTLQPNSSPILTFGKYAGSEMVRKTLSREDVARIVQRGEEGQVQFDSVSPKMMEKGRQAALRMVGAKRESMPRSLDMVDERFGGTQRHLRERGRVHYTQLEALRINNVVVVMMVWAKRKGCNAAGSDEME
ncbi:hypothetical protein COCVIDRAFT_21084 [Bipolaris victoriae FI3]|uniref:Uncharacterized protein n=1 Tax=Bipolaris victoriae (strain FI3) TaxID=930091 RepID=W7DRR1_BIPV3|nr:hypothetical protein COCVIDRAFT_21084 [Bipolaris victoriae FI3]